MNPYLYLFRKHFNGYMIIAILLVVCYFIRVRNIYTMKHYKSIMDADKKKQKAIKATKPTKLSKSDRKKSKKTDVNEGFESNITTSAEKNKTNVKPILKNLQPCYESRLDTIYKRIEDRYDNSEHKLAEDYNKVYNEYLEEEKKKSFDINPIQSLTEFEDSIFAMIDGKPENKYGAAYVRKTYAGNAGSYFDRNTVPAKGVDVSQEMSRNAPDLPISDNTIEGFTNDVSGNTVDDISSIKKMRKKKENYETVPYDKKKNSSDLTTLDKFLTGDTITNIMQYGLDNTNRFLGGIDMSSNKISDFATKEDNMVPMGVILIIISLMLYFADLSS